jgi:hypothetical protein
VAGKLTHLAAPFFLFSAYQALIIGLPFALAMLAHLSLSWRAVARSPLGVSALVFLILYFAFPASALGAYDADIRFLMPAFMLPFCVPGTNRRSGGQGLVSALVLIAIIAHAVVVYWVGHKVDADLRDERRLLRAIPSGQHLLALVTDGRRFGRIDPFRHFALWYTIDHPESRVNSLFDRGSAPHLAHFEANPPLYDPGTHWGTVMFDKLSIADIRRDYTLVLSSGCEPLARARILDVAVPIRQLGVHILYMIHERSK